MTISYLVNNDFGDFTERNLRLFCQDLLNAVINMAYNSLEVLFDRPTEMFLLLRNRENQAIFFQNLTKSAAYSRTVRNFRGPSFAR